MVSLHVRHALQKFLNRRYLDTPVSQLDDFSELWEELSTNIHVSAHGAFGSLLSFIALEIPSIYRCRLSFAVWFSNCSFDSFG